MTLRHHTLKTAHRLARARGCSFLALFTGPRGDWARARVAERVQRSWREYSEVEVWRVVGEELTL
jgi:hypothetical protein